MATNPSRQDMTAAELALSMRGADQGEIDSIGLASESDAQADSWYRPEYQASGGPIYKALWRSWRFPSDGFSTDRFLAGDKSSDTDLQKRSAAMEEALSLVQSYARQDRLYDADNLVSRELKDRLKELRIWGLTIPVAYGGLGATSIEFFEFMRQVAFFCPTLAGMLSVNQCIGALRPVLLFGTERQKRELLPRMAAGQEGCFAATEPGVGSDLNNTTTALTDGGDCYILNGVKLFITNPVHGGVAGVLCRLMDRTDSKGKHPLGILVVDIPDHDTDEFRFEEYPEGLGALVHAENRMLIFRNFKVPKNRLLEHPKMSGFAMAMCLLNYGRVALTLNASSAIVWQIEQLRHQWTRERQSMGKALREHQAVQGHLGEMASMALAAHAMGDWGAALLERGYRTEAEGAGIKGFGAHALKSSTVDHAMFVQGGRCFLKHHWFMKYLGDHLAPSIYEGSWDVLCLAMQQSLLKQMADSLLKPMLTNRPLQKVAPAVSFVGWALWHLLGPRTAFLHDALPRDRRLRGHMRWAMRRFSQVRRQIVWSVVRYGPKLDTQELLLKQLSTQVLDCVLILVTCQHAARGDALTKLAADVFCRRARRPGHWQQTVSDHYYCAKLGKQVGEKLLDAPADIPSQEILFHWDEWK